MTALNPSWPYLQGSITVNSAGLVKTAGLFINGALKMKDIPIQVLPGGSGVINTNEHDITIGNIDAASGASSSLSIIAGLSNTITIGAVGSANPLASFSIPSDGASSVSLSNVTTKGAISILSPNCSIKPSLRLPLIEKLEPSRVACSPDPNNTSLDSIDLSCECGELVKQ